MVLAVYSQICTHHFTPGLKRKSSHSLTSPSDLSWRGVTLFFRTVLSPGSAKPIAEPALSRHGAIEAVEVTQGCETAYGARSHIGPSAAWWAGGGAFGLLCRRSPMRPRAPVFLTASPAAGLRHGRSLIELK